MSLDSADWASIQYQNANNSVRVTDAFMEAVSEGKEWALTARTDGTVVETVDARGLLRDLAAAAWECADPGVQYDTTINAWHTSPNTGRINASNPCSEYMHIDDSACNLASLNLMKFRREDGEFDVEMFEHAVDVVFLARRSSSATRRTRRPRSAGTPSGSASSASATPTSARSSWRAGCRTTRTRDARTPRRSRLMTGRAYRKSAEVAKRMGPHAGYQENRAAMVGVIAKHRAAVGNIQHADSVPDDLLTGARHSWDEALEIGEVHGFRNAQGDGARAHRDDQLHDGLRHDGRGAGLLARQVEEARRRRRDHDRQQDGADGAPELGYAPREVEEIVAYIDERGGVVGAPHLKTEHYPVFDAIGERAIHYMGHVKMMGAVQPFISGAISKTVDLPEQTTIDEIAKLFVESWQLGSRRLRSTATTARSPSRSRGRAPDKAAALLPVGATGVVPHPQRRRLRRSAGRPQVQGRRLRGVHPRRPVRGRDAGRHLRGHREGGHDLAGLMNSFMISVSLGLQYGVPLEVAASRSSATCASSRAG